MSRPLSNQIFKPRFDHLTIETFYPFLWEHFLFCYINHTWVTFFYSLWNMIDSLRFCESTVKRQNIVLITWTSFQSNNNTAPERMSCPNSALSNTKELVIEICPVFNSPPFFDSRKKDQDFFLANFMSRSYGEEIRFKLSSWKPNAQWIVIV